MTKAELVKKVASKIKLSRKQAEDVVNIMTQSISDSLAGGEKVEIRGFGSFRIRERNGRIARNPGSGEMVEVPAKKVPFFKAGNDLRKMVDGEGY
jgi:integration host factor subunit beta